MVKCLPESRQVIRMNERHYRYEHNLNNHFMVDNLVANAYLKINFH
jgi:hypothetical protein